MTKSQEDIRKDLTDLGSVMRTFAKKSDGLEQAVRAIEHRQEGTDKAIKSLDQKYEEMMNMMAQIMAKLNDKGKEVEGCCSWSDQKMELVKGKSEKAEGRKEN